MNISETIIRSVHRGILHGKKHSPRALFAVGIVGTVASTVMACRSTLKLSETLTDCENELNDVKNPQDTAPDNKAIAYVYAKNVFRVTRLYAPAAVIGGVSIAALTGSHVILTNRNNALGAAYALMSQSFDAYRDRVTEELGPEKEAELRHTTLVKNEKGKLVTHEGGDPGAWSPYAHFFDETSHHWTKHPESNRMLVQCQEKHANDLLKARGHVFLNEVYDMLGLDRSSAGQFVGWVSNGTGDNYISFGIFDERNSRFVNGWERSVILDFNVDGQIFDLI